MRRDEQVRLIKELVAQLDSGTNVDFGGGAALGVDSFALLHMDDMASA